MRRLGLTGSIGSGKSTVAALLRERGLPVLDADVVAREVSASPDVVREVQARLGPAYVRDGALDRPALAALVFHDAAARETLNAIVHPRVRAEMRRLERDLEAGGATCVVQDIPLLFENDLQDQFDATILVDAPLETRVARVTKRDGITESAARARDAAQMPAARKRHLATVVLDNDGDLEHLARQVDAALAVLAVAARPA